jgi:hypothetical protein
VPPFVEVTVTEFVKTPGVPPTTVTEIVHDAPTASVAPVSVTVPDPGIAVTVPPQVVESPFGL